MMRDHWAVLCWSRSRGREFKCENRRYEMQKVPVAGSKRKRVIRRLRSTARLKVRPWHGYMDQVMAFAVTDLGVEFSEPPYWWNGDNR